MRATTIQKRINEINELWNRCYEIELASEAEYGFVTEAAEKKMDKLSDRHEKLIDKVVAELHAKGLCSEDGITSEEADNTFFDEIENLHTIGDGSWC